MGPKGPHVGVLFLKKLICNFSFVLMVFVNVNVNYLIGEDEN